jgi:beta-mannanase
MAPIDAWAADSGHAPSLVMWYQAWGGPGSAFDATALSHVADRGAVPMVTWEPWDWQAGMSQSAYSLRNIVKGRYDAFIRTWARAAKAWGRPMLLRFAHEMNATPYPWAAFTNGNTPARYISAWRHVHGIFTTVGATNVSWVWSPSIIGAGRVGLSSVYPGNAYVDWVAADGYNGGSALSWGGWLSFGQLFNSTLDAFNTLAPGKPQMIGETSSAEAGGNKATWIADMFASLALRPQVRALVWFNQDKETDWRIESSAAAQTAFAIGAAAPRWR